MREDEAEVASSTAGKSGRMKFASRPNPIARRALDLAEGAAVTLEAPSTSYLWAFLEFDSSLASSDATFSPCRSGPNLDDLVPDKLG